MMIAKVVGNVVATKKNPALSGQKILVVQSVDGAGQVHGQQLLAFDAADAGIGDIVIVTAEGGAAKQLLRADKNSPVDLCIAGILDHYGPDGRRC